jgi:hypothetical protein
VELKTLFNLQKYTNDVSKDVLARVVSFIYHINTRYNVFVAVVIV